MGAKIQTDAIKQVKDELTSYASTGNSGPFQPSPDALASVSRLIRELEIKRQTGVLTDNETSQLKEVDELWENMAKANARKKPPAVLGQNIYDLKNKRIFQESEDSIKPERPIIPQISSRQADEIIAGINEQFEEKVLKKIRERDHVAGSTAGRSLQDYLSTFKSGSRNIPLAGDDSRIDLNKLAKKSSQ